MAGSLIFHRIVSKQHVIVLRKKNQLNSEDNLNGIHPETFEKPLNCKLFTSRILILGAMFTSSLPEFLGKKQSGYSFTSTNQKKNKQKNSAYEKDFTSPDPRPDMLSALLLAQIPNGDFENLNSDGTISNWGKCLYPPKSWWILPVMWFLIQSLQTDLTIKDYGCSGMYAMEMRNSYDFTLNTGRARERKFWCWFSVLCLGVPRIREYSNATHRF